MWTGLYVKACKALDADIYVAKEICGISVSSKAFIRENVDEISKM